MILVSSKTLFSVTLPATGKSYDFWVPNDMCMIDVNRLVAEAMQTIEPDYFTSSADSALMYLRTGQLQDPAVTVGEIGFTDGDKFMLV